MKKKKGMGLLYFLAYISWLLAGLVPAMLLFKSSVALNIIFIIVFFLVLPAIILGQVYEHKNTYHPSEYHFKMHFYFTVGGFGGVILLSLIGLIIEAVFTANNEAAPYAWFAVSTSLALMILSSLLYFRRLYMEKKIEKELKEN